MLLTNLLRSFQLGGNKKTLVMHLLGNNTTAHKVVVFFVSVVLTSAASAAAEGTRASRPGRDGLMCYNLSAVPQLTTRGRGHRLLGAT